MPATPSCPTWGRVQCPAVTFPTVPNIHAHWHFFPNPHQFAFLLEITLEGGTSSLLYLLLGHFFPQGWCKDTKKFTWQSHEDLRTKLSSSNLLCKDETRPYRAQYCVFRGCFLSWALLSSSFIYQDLSFTNKSASSWITQGFQQNQ